MMPTHVLFRETDAFNGQKKRKTFPFAQKIKACQKNEYKLTRENCFSPSIT